MVFSKPTDAVVIVAVLGVIFGVVGLGISGVESAGVTVNNSAIFTNIAGEIDDPTGMRRSADSASLVIDPTGSETPGQTTEEGFLFRGLKGLFDLGASFK